MFLIMRAKIMMVTKSVKLWGAVVFFPYNLCIVEVSMIDMSICARVGWPWVLVESG